MKSSFVEQESSQGWGVTNLLAHSLLKLMAISFNRRPALKEYLRWDGGWIDMSIGMETESGSVRQGISFRDGHARVHSSVPDDANAVLVFKDEATVREMISSPPNELFNLLMKNKIVPRGNLAYLQLFNFLISVLMKNKHIKMLKKASAKEQAGKNLKSNGSSGPRAPAYLRAKHREKGVKYLEDAYLSDYGIEDFPRLKDFLDIHFTVRPAICHERPLLLTEFFMKHGFEKDADGRVTEVRAQALEDSKSGTPGSDAYKVKGNLHWVSAAHALDAEVRLYDRLYANPYPGAGDADHLASLNPDSKKVIRAKLEPTLASAMAGDLHQFERHGYFVADRVDSKPGAPVFNRAVTLKDSWGGRR